MVSRIRKVTKMTNYIYRIVYRVKEDRWDWKKDPALNVWKPCNTRPYTSSTAAKGITTRNNNDHSGLEFRYQRLPADNWEFVE
jgi:hypothetical protein